MSYLIWHKQVPLKVSIFAWRLLRNRLRTRSNLLDRGIISDVDAGCLAGCAHMETSQHLFLSCDLRFVMVGSAVLAWCVGTISFSVSQTTCISLLTSRAVRAQSVFHAACLVTLRLDYME